MASITKRPDGRWRARYRDPSGKELARHFTRRVDAQRWLDETAAAVVTGMYVDPQAGKVTVASFYAEWSQRQVWELTTVRAMDLSVRSATFADLPIGSVRRSHVERWVKSMTSAGLAPGTIRTRVNNVRAVLRAAVRDRVIGADPSAGVILPRRRRVSAAMTLPAAEQVRALLDGADERFQALLALAAFAGLRLGEAAAVQVGDIDFLRRRLHVRRQVQCVNGGTVEVRAPKYGSERVVFVADSLADLLAEHVRLHCPGTEPKRWLFTARPHDQPPHQNTVEHQWRRTCRRAGIDGLTLHDLRHFYASGLIAAGCDVVTVQRALGHAKATTTLDTYAHLWPTAEDRTREAAQGIVTEVLDPRPKIVLERDSRT